MPLLPSVTVGELLAVFKRVKAGAGELTGNYYLASTGKDYALVVKLTARDTAGKKTLNEGKAARRALGGGAKFARGTVRFIDRRFVFELTHGTLPKELMKLVLRKKLAAQSAKLAFLKRAVVVEPEEAVLGAVEADLADSEFAEDEDPLSTTDLDGDEIAELKRVERELGDLNDALEALLSSASSAEEIEEQRVQATIRLQELRGLQLEQGWSEELDAEIRNAREELVSLCSVGTEPVVSLGSPVSSVTTALLAICDDLEVDGLVGQLSAVNERLEQILAQFETLDEEQAIAQARSDFVFYTALGDRLAKTIERTLEAG